MGNLVPARELGQIIGSYLHREQSIGEARGLSRLQRLLDARKYELQVKLGLLTPEKPFKQEQPVDLPL